MTSIPVPIMPNGLFYIVAFAAILAMVLALMGISKSFRKLYLATSLIPMGIMELSIVSYYSANSYYIPHEVFFISFATITCGAAIPVLYAARRLLNNAIARISLFFSGWIELALAVNWLPSFRYFYPFYNVVLVVVFATISSCSITASILLSVVYMRKRKASGVGGVKNP